MRSKPKALIIGAGAVGRGLLAPKLIDAGYIVDFVDKDFHLIERLDLMKYYPLVGRGQFKWIGPVGAQKIYQFDYKNLDYEYIFISVKANNLESVSLFVQKILNYNKQKPVIYVIENLTNAASKFENMLGASSAIVLDGIANVIVPLSPHQNADPSFTVYDPKMELVLKKSKGYSIINTVRYVTDDEFELEWLLKMYLHCSIHAFVGWWGRKHGFEYVHEIITSQPHDRIVADLMLTIVDAIDTYIGKTNTAYIERRMHVEYSSMCDHLLADDNYRVSRDSLRKLEPDDRLIGLLYFLKKNLGTTLGNPSYRKFVQVTNMAIADAELTPRDILALPSWSNLTSEALEEYMEIIEDLENEWE